MKALYQYNKVKLIVSFILFILAIVLLLPLMLNTLKSVIETGITPDRSFGYGLTELAEIRQIYGPEGAKIYFSTRFSYDLIWMLVYVFFFINLLAFLSDGLKAKWLLAIKVLPLLAFISDLFENCLCSIYFFNGHIVIGSMAVMASQIKWYSLLLIFILVIILSIYRIYQKIKT